MKVDHHNHHYRLHWYFRASLKESNQNKSVPLLAVYWNSGVLLVLVICINLERNCFIVKRCGREVQGWIFNSALCKCMSLLPRDGTAGNLFAFNLDTNNVPHIWKMSENFYSIGKICQATARHPWYFRAYLCKRNKKCVHPLVLYNYL